jgi:hypothetical protein
MAVSGSCVVPLSFTKEQSSLRTQKRRINNTRLPRPVIYYTVIFKFLLSHIPFNFLLFTPLFLT